MKDESRAARRSLLPEARSPDEVAWDGDDAWGIEPALEPACMASVASGITGQPISVPRTERPRRGAVHTVQDSRLPLSRAGFGS